MLIVQAVADTYVDAVQPTTAMGDAWRLRLAPSGARDRRLMLVRFALPVLPPETELVSARLDMQAVSRSNAGHLQMRIGPASQPWDEQITYLDALRSPGLHRMAPSVSALAAGLREASWDITGIVRGWYAGDYANDGLVIDAPAEDNGGSVTYAWLAREWGGGGPYGPSLRIAYRLLEPTPALREAAGLQAP